MRWIHIAGGLIGISSGAVALFALKGAALHRRSGLVFVSAMLVMSATATVLAIRQPYAGNVVASALTFYMVSTALLTVRRPWRARVLDVVATLGVVALGIASIRHGLIAQDDQLAPGGYPPLMYLAFGGAAGLLAVQDLRQWSAESRHGASRLTRHLGRMVGAMLVATASFFLGQPQVFAGGPLEPIAVRATPVALVAGALVYWRFRMARRPLAAGAVNRRSR